MSGTRVPPPGNPTPRQLAAADQKHAIVRAGVDHLARQAHHKLNAGYDPRDVGVWLELSMNDCLDAGLSMSSDRDELVSALACLLGEAVLRLAGSRP